MAARGEHALVIAQTGSGKTLAAFLDALDQLFREGGEDTRVAHSRILYISPIKALGTDVQRNLQIPLQGIADERRRRSETEVNLRMGSRTGDTPAQERSKLTRNPPDILITTPESLYLMLTSRARETLRGVETVIIDDTHLNSPQSPGSSWASCLCATRLAAGILQHTKAGWTLVVIAGGATKRYRKDAGAGGKYARPLRHHQSSGGDSRKYPWRVPSMQTLCRSMEDSRRIMRGRFVEGLGGAQFAERLTIDRLRDLATQTTQTRHYTPVALSANDPANVWGNLLPWPAHPATLVPTRRAGALVVVSGGKLLLYLAQGGKKMLVWQEKVELLTPEIFHALTTALRREPRLRFTLTEVNDLPVRQTPMFTLLREAGFSSSPQGLDWG